MNRNRLSVGLLLLAFASRAPGQTFLFSNVTATVSSQVNGLTNAINAVASDGTSFVLVGNNSTVVSSTTNGLTTGLTWTKRALSTAKLIPLSAVTFGNGLCVIGGSNATVFTSANGTSWPATAAPSPLFAPYLVGGLAYNGANFVAAAETSQIDLADGNITAWQTTHNVNNVFVESYRGAITFGGNFAVCGVGGVIRTNSGTNWYPLAGKTWSGTNADLHGLAWDGNQTLVAVGLNWTNKNGGTSVPGATIAASANNGTSFSYASAGTANNLNEVVFGGATGFVAVGDNGTILGSVDGFNWGSYQGGGVPNTNLLGIAFATNGPLQNVAVVTGLRGTVLLGGYVPLAPGNPASQTNFTGITNLALSVTESFTALTPVSTLSVDWYDNASNLVATGTTTFTPGDTSIGTHRYFVVERDVRTGFQSTSVEADFVVVPFTNVPNATTAFNQTNFAGITNLNFAVTINANNNLDGDLINVVNWYDASSNLVSGNTLTFTPTNLAPGIYHYYATEVVTNASCSSCVSTSINSAAFTFTVVTFTNAPTSPAGQATCSGTPDGTPLSVTLNANPNFDGDVITVNWFNSAAIIPANQVATNSTTFLPPDTIVGVHKYFAVEVVTNTGCSSCMATSTTATEVDFTINPLPLAPTFVSNQTNCAGVVPNPSLTVVPPSTNGLNGTNVVVNWLGSNNGSGLTFVFATATNSIVPTNTVPGTYTYYALSEVLPTGCTSLAVTPVTFVLQDCLSGTSGWPTITNNGAGVTVKWLGNVDLQYTNALNPQVTNGWVIISNGVAGTTNSFQTNNASGSNGFFRLIAP